MENTTQFELNSALRLWLERLGQSPQVKAENLQELEAHLRDSMGQLESKGLSAEESFLIATRRAGNVAQLEPEFAKVNRNPLNKIIHGLILGFFSLGCWLLWALLHFPRMMAHSIGQLETSPALTRFVVGLCIDNSFPAAPPILAAVYCVYVWLRKSLKGNSWAGFFAVTTATLFLLTLGTFIALFLPVIAYMNRALPK